MRWRPEDNFWVLVLSLRVPGNQTWVVILGGQCLGLLSHLPDLICFFLNLKVHISFQTLYVGSFPSLTDSRGPFFAEGVGNAQGGSIGKASAD